MAATVGGSEQRSEFAMLEAVHRAGLRHRDDAQRVGAGADLDLRGQAVEFWFNSTARSEKGKAARTAPLASSSPNGRNRESNPWASLPG